MTFGTMTRGRLWRLALLSTLISASGCVWLFVPHHPTRK
jgi:hypothetical protein